MSDPIGSLDDLNNAVQKATRQKVKEKKEGARRRAEETSESAKEQADKVKSEILNDARAQAEEKRRQQLVDARTEAKRKRLLAREEILNGVWEQAESRLRELAESEDYMDVLRRQARTAAIKLGGGQVTLASDVEGQPLLEEARLSSWSEQLNADEDAWADRPADPVEYQKASDPVDGWGGLVASKNEGRKRIDGRFSVRLQMARRELRDDVWRTLRSDE